MKGRITHSKRHFRIVLPNGRTVYASKTPGDYREIRNLKTKIRRAV